MYLFIGSQENFTINHLKHIYLPKTASYPADTHLINFPGLGFPFHPFIAVTENQFQLLNCSTNISCGMDGDFGGISTPPGKQVFPNRM